MGIKLVKKITEASSEALEYSVGSTVIIKVNRNGQYMMRCTPEYANALEMDKNAYTWGLVTSGTAVREANYIAKDIRTSAIGLIGKAMAEGRNVVFRDPIAIAKAAEAVCKDIASSEYDAVAEKIHNDYQEKFLR